MNENIAKILWLTTFLLAYMRFSPEDSKNIALLNIIKSLYSRDIDKWDFNEYCMNLMELIPFLSFENSNQFTLSMEIVNRNTEINYIDNNLLDIIKYKKLISEVCDDGINLYRLKQFQQLSDLIDTFHALPEALTNKMWNEKHYWKRRIDKYQKRWKDIRFKKLRKTYL